MTYPLISTYLCLYCAVSCSMRSITTVGLFSLPPRGAKPRVPSGPLGCLMTTTLAAPRAISSMFIAFSLESSRSGRWAVLREEDNKFPDCCLQIQSRDSPELPDTACGVFPGSLVGDHHELHLVPDLENLPALNLGHVEEEFLPLLLFIGQESELT